jgi:predicted lipid-binding transport protein (Tim44 family)
MVEFVEGKSFKGGRSFKMTPNYKKQPAQPSKQMSGQKSNTGSVSRGIMGGLLGGALGAMLFGSLFGMGGQGMGILPLLLLAGGAYFLYKRLGTKRGSPPGARSRQSPLQNSPEFMGRGPDGAAQGHEPHTPDIGTNIVADGLDQIRRFDPGFDPSYFKEVASDVFFQVQAGWMRRDLDSYKHLLGETLAKEYEGHFARMREEGIINKLESIAVRAVEISQAGSDGREDFVTVRFTASLLDYNVDDQSGEVVSGSPTTPVKFDEEWTWARPTGTQNWRLEGIH